jgi:hypothetical protein
MRRRGGGHSCRLAAMTASAQSRPPLGPIASSPRQVFNYPRLPGTRWMNLVRAGYGIALLCLPGTLITAVTGDPASVRVRAVARVLGARQLAQAAICGLAPVRDLIEAGVAADGLHAASMLMMAGAEPGLRRALLTDAVIAATFAGAAATSVRRTPASPSRVC